MNEELTCEFCGHRGTDVSMTDYQQEKVPLCDDIKGCIDRGAKRIVEQNKEKGVKNA